MEDALRADRGRRGLRERGGRGEREGKMGDVRNIELRQTGLIRRSKLAGFSRSVVYFDPFGSRPLAGYHANFRGWNNLPFWCLARRRGEEQ